MNLASLVTLAIAVTWVLLGVYLLLPRPATSPIPSSENPFYFTAFAVIGVMLTFATYAGAVIAVALVVTIQTIARFVEAGLAWIPRGRRLGRGPFSAKAGCVSCGTVGVADGWLDGP